MSEGRKGRGGFKTEGRTCANSGCNMAEHVQAVTDLRGRRMRRVEGEAPPGCITEGPESLVEDYLLTFILKDMGEHQRNFRKESGLIVS